MHALNSIPQLGPASNFFMLLFYVKYKVKWIVLLVVKMIIIYE